MKPAMARFFQLQTFENKIFLGTHFLHLQKYGEEGRPRVLFKQRSARLLEGRLSPHRSGKISTSSARGAIANDVAEEPHCLVLHRNDLIERLRLSHAPR